MKVFHVIIGRRSTQGDAGVTSIEYGLVATAIALAVTAGVASLGPKVIEIFTAIGS